QKGWPLFLVDCGANCGEGSRKTGAKRSNSLAESGYRFATARLWLYLVLTMPRLARRFLYSLIALMATLTIGTVGFVLIEHFPVFDAFYLTLITMTTVGYSEIHTLSHAGRVFNSFLIIFGVSTIFIAIGAMTQTIIEREFGEALGKRRNKR